MFEKKSLVGNFYATTNQANLSKVLPGTVTFQVKYQHFFTEKKSNSNAPNSDLFKGRFF